ncbi:MAG: glycosyltransferase [Elusimicrobiota bacterium]
MRLKIFHLDSERSWRGGEQQVLYLAEELERAGQTNFIIAPAQTRLETKTKSLGIRFFPLSIAGEWDLKAVWRLRKLIRAESPDILHCHSAHAHAIGLLACLGKNSPKLIVSRRVDFPIRYKGKYTCKIAKIIVVSEGIRKVLLAGGIKDENIAVVKDGVDLAYFRRQPCEHLYKELKLVHDQPVVGTVAALAPHKDYPNFLQAAYWIHQKMPEVQFLIVGEGEEENKIKELTRKLGLENVVVFAGFRSDIPAVLSLFDVFALSSYLEGMGQVLVEAMLVGLPVVATNTGGIPDVVVDGLTGFLAPPRDSEKLAGKIIELLQDKDKRLGFAVAGQKRALEFSKQKTAKETEKIYFQVMSLGS